MTAPLPRLYAHPFSSYSQKVLIALYENATPFDYRNLEDPQANTELTALWPMRRFPILVDRGRTVIEASSVVEYLQLHHPGPVRLIPDDADAALEVRMLDRFFDHYVSTPQQKVVLDRLRPEPERDDRGVREARAMLETSYAWLDERIAALQSQGRVPPSAPTRAARLAGFQQSQGIEAGGPAGPITFMQANLASGVDEPRLQPSS